MKSEIIIRPECTLSVDTNELRFRKPGKPIKIVRLEPITSQILNRIAINEALVTREELVQEIWDGNEGVGNPALTKNIYKIRKVFELEGCKNPIETLPKKGYRLTRITPRSRMIRKKVLIIAGSLFIGFVALKLLVPGILNQVWHLISHRLGH